MTKGKKVRCSKCYGQGYTVSPEHYLSKAHLCECVLECKVCEGRGIIHVYDDDNRYSYLESCSTCGPVRNNVKKYNYAAIPAKYHNILEVDTFKHDGNLLKQKALKYAKDKFLRGFPNYRGFLLMGPSGVGKTHLAVGTISELTLKKGIVCVFKDFFLLLSELRQAYSEGRSENEVLEPLVEAEVLLIDELGKGKSSEWELGILDQLISKRYNSSKKTLITTNYIAREYVPRNAITAEILENKVGERIASRLYEMCEFFLLEGEDYRKRIGKNQKFQ